MLIIQFRSHELGCPYEDHVQQIDQINIHKTRKHVRNRNAYKHFKIIHDDQNYICNKKRMSGKNHV